MSATNNDKLGSVTTQFTEDEWIYTTYEGSAYPWFSVFIRLKYSHKTTIYLVDMKAITCYAIKYVAFISDEVAIFPSVTYLCGHLQIRWSDQWNKKKRMQTTRMQRILTILVPSFSWCVSGTLRLHGDDWLETQTSNVLI